MDKAQAQFLKELLHTKKYEFKKEQWKTESFGYYKFIVRKTFGNNDELKIGVLFYEGGESQVSVSFNAILSVPHIDNCSISISGVNERYTIDDFEKDAQSFFDILKLKF